MRWMTHGNQRRAAAQESAGRYERPGHLSRRAAALVGAFLLAGLLVPVQGAAQAEPVRLLAFGDSLVAGYGLPEAEGFVTRLTEALAARGHEVEIINGGVSGDSTAGGRSRLDWALADAPDAVILELGANDALRGIPPQVTRDNLTWMLDRLAREEVPVLFAGMLAPPNMGPQYGEAFNGIFPDLATRYDVVFYPFFLDGVAAEAALNQADGMHPNADGVDVIVERILPYVETLLERAEAQRSAT